ncbi:glucose-6-phosphate dehydrogenase [Prosthecomicrobium pneumaticum]|uniref:Glucose-6-phosphate 1-dehydrogenase n=1 Tax=Prosthecomicrobium pneumaticum TaxID=81895 RepID=A0A7W9L1Z9_9HYPH|nr:glucose-6-phosphate dehydrogenase [Prosthecomicrobium pneumaticum]MBB5753170.1 glucose-6-phosphate 1-dehydrogenase [Prosthecomicrobium pneumaticum]
MTSRIIAVDPFDLVVFGATGDLAYRKLLPALYQRHRDGQIPPVARIIGASRRPMSDEAYRDATEKALASHVPAAEREPETVKSFLERISYVAVDASADGAGWADLKATLDEGADRIRAFYLAVGPDLFGAICEGIGAHGLITEKTRVIIEKPIGKDLASARAVNDAIGRVFDERQIYRIDHYLGKETVQNLMALRFGNALFEPLWNAAHIDHVQITVAESLGVESRAGYYDTAGALRDMVQNHILQLLCLVAMEPPSHFDADAMRDEKLKVLRALLPITDDNLDQFTVRGQYRAGASQGGAVPGYLEELGRTDSTTETFVAIKAEIENWRWAGVPFYIRTGKRLATRVSEIVVSFKPIPHSIFDSSAGHLTQNQLVMRLQPDEAVRLSLMIKDPGPGGMRLRNVPLDMSFAQAFKVRSPDAYERLIMDVIRGNATLFMRRDEVEAAWTWIDPILGAWERTAVPPKAYTAGTWGPSAAIALIERDGRTWHEEVL